ncbi:MAG: hypothetical protein HYT19_01520, partial [Candidatus Nealsonbacteria bacterium]|nr:hypothetical protein [Candidatus Nealsonbacteria bacterium]
FKTYYLAEAGVNEAIWKLKNDETTADGDNAWEICFSGSSAECLNCASWQDTFSRKYTNDSTTTVTISNSYCAQGTINATTTLFLSQSKTSQRVVEVKVLKSLGSLTLDSPVFSGAPSGESTIQSSLMNIYNGNIFSNNNINIKLGSTVKVYDNQSTTEQEGQVLANQNVNVTWSTLQSSSTCAKNMCTIGICAQCPIDSFEMPAVDFDSIASTSYKSRAQSAEAAGQCSALVKNAEGSTIATSSQCVFSSGEFEDLLWQAGPSGKVVLEYKNNGAIFSVYYVEGTIDLKGQRYLEINGVLIADSTVNIGENFCWGKGQQSWCGFDQIAINDPGGGIPSGILTKGKINLGLYSSFGSTSVTGLIYSQDEMRITSIPYSFTVIGGMIARKFTLSSAWAPLNIYLDNDIIREGVWGSLQPPEGVAVPYSPVVTVEHWEETY